MTNDEAVAALDAIHDGDPERFHYEADGIILEYVPADVLEAYGRVVNRCGWWAWA